MDRNPWIPHAPHPRQRQFLLLADVLEVLYGGAAGGGKTSASLMAAAQYVDVPGYSALLLRQSFPDIQQPDALIPRSKAWWYGKAGWHSQERRWTFPSGATITFGYLERDDDVYQYQGAAYQGIFVDELTQHSEFRWRYLFSRLRKPNDGPLAAVPLRMRATSNPGGSGHEWVKRRFVDPRTRTAGSVFVPARLDDNPSLDAAAYRGSLQYLDPFTRAQLLAGDWDAVAGGRFRRDWFKYYGRRGEVYVVDGKGVEPRQLRLVFLTADTAASTKTTADYTVISAWGITRDHKLLWLDCHRGRWEVPDILPEIQAQYAKHDAAFVGIEAVAGHSGTGVYQLARRTKMIVRAMTPRSRDKLERATPAIVLAESGRLWLPAARPAWVEDAEAELAKFTGDPRVDSNDDIVDTLSYACDVLSGNEQATHQGFAPYVGGV